MSLLICCLAHSQSLAQTAVTWTGNAGNNLVTDVANWTPTPDYSFSSSGTFELTVDGDNNSPSGNADLVSDTIFISTFQSLDLGAGDRLTIATNDFFVDDLVNDGTIVVSNDGGVFPGTLLVGATPITGGGTIELVGAELRTFRDFSSPTETPLRNASTISGFGTINSELEIFNQSTGVIDANVPGETLNVPITSTFGIFRGDNAGVLRASNGGDLAVGFDRFGNTFEFTNSGLIQAQDQSTVRLNSLDISGGEISATGTGIVEIFSGSLEDVEVSGNIEFRNLVDAAGTITNRSLTVFSGDVPQGGSLVGNDVTLQGGGVLELDGLFFGSNVTNVDNTVTGTGTFGVAVNAAAGVIEADDGQFLFIGQSEAATIDNAGILRATNGALLSVFEGGLDNQGLIEAVGTDSVFFGGDAILNGVSGVLAGDGIIAADSILNLGFISPGSFDTDDVELLTIESALTLDTSSTIHIDINGLALGQHDELFVDGSLFLDGLLEIDAAGFSLGSLNELTIITGNDISGNFANIAFGDTQNSLDGSLRFELGFDDSEATQRIFLDNLQVVPEPSTFLLIVAAGMACGTRRRRAL